MSESSFWKPSPTRYLGPNPEHLDQLSNGVNAWNVWRQQHPDVFPVLRMAELSNINMRGANLSNVDFLRADLSNADLFECNLFQAEFFGANLRGSDLGQTDLRGAKFHNTDLQGASLQFADLFRADFIGSRLEGVDFTMARCWTTAFSNVDLSLAVGLAQVNHTGPSSVDIATLFRSGASLPIAFLRGVGLPDEFIEYLPSLLTAAHPSQFYSCFISYSTEDESFAKHLRKRMRDEHLRVWFAPEDIAGGEKIHEQIYRAIRSYDKLLLVLSESSMQSEWVMSEIRNARRLEMIEKKRKLFPIRLVDFESIRKWSAFDSDTGKDLATEMREYFIPDFSNWRDPKSFEDAFARLLRDLKATSV